MSDAILTRLFRKPWTTYFHKHKLCLITGIHAGIWTVTLRIGVLLFSHRTLLCLLQEKRKRKEEER